MPHHVTSFEPTPNPNAIKCIVNPSPGDAPRSYFNADQANEAGDKLAIALFNIPGVTNILIHSAFITVSKQPKSTWPAIKKHVKKALTKAP